jgi:hypothetical protein
VFHTTVIEKGGPSVQFIGLDLQREMDMFYASMTTYITRLEVLPKDACFDRFRRLRAQLLCVCNSRPDLCAFVSICSSTTAATFAERDIWAINKQVAYLLETKNIRLCFPPLDVETLHWEELRNLTGRHVPLLMLTDSAGVFDAITRHRRTTEGRLMLDIYAAREAYKNREIDNIALIRTQYNVADAMRCPVILLS